MSLILITGGARSGKSRFAEMLAAQYADAGAVVCFVATAQALDDEMKERIHRHRLSRDAQWQTVEEPFDPAAVVRAEQADVYLIDCLSLLLANWVFASRVDESGFWDKLKTLVDALASSRATCIVVTNEIGLGIVPADPETRLYRDWLGWMNQTFARSADQVFLVTSGIAVNLKALPGAIMVH
ncbi:adenosylcobinamide kinase /adenosylcobinamide-phosphate guanylyltransferase [Alicyclobacillus sacchari]|uniref:Adenosylcobinamide kinase n=1 Tax=Alicyclobacillus sacchari TaxID=392010 RepID=A0A4R8LNW2_9BACL|nr:bifunctional adenosylcobinamide kinase/adenosylcobinamide-phosphate guanylyltransferase [Alicyclobacillus sacchari]TDY47961.1 adenosylcobinamide kinase /adenosylcobinamide-phosphate guanylyltransferase [Alicyclobacillus sacchari]